MRVAPIGSENNLFPNGEFMPEDGVQRGSIISIKNCILKRDLKLVW